MNADSNELERIDRRILQVLQRDGRMADMAAYRNFPGTVRWQLPGVRETRPYAVMEEVKNTTQLALPQGTATPAPVWQ